jgi:hypothetical protein
MSRTTCALLATFGQLTPARRLARIERSLARAAGESSSVIRRRGADRDTTAADLGRSRNRDTGNLPKAHRHRMVPFVLNERA